jgi:hypothetical protein
MPKLAEQIEKSSGKLRKKKGEFNIKMLRSLERIEKKLEKESDSSRIGSH